MRDKGRHHKAAQGGQDVVSFHFVLVVLGRGRFSGFVLFIPSGKLATQVPKASRVEF
jgi:hypothetical protein